MDCGWAGQSPRDGAVVRPPQHLTTRRTQPSASRCCGGKECPARRAPAPYSGGTVGTWLDILPGALDRRTVTLRDIVQTARYDFGLTRNDLKAVTRAALLVLLCGGARLVQPRHLVALPALDGATPEAIAEAIIDAWVAWGSGDPSIHAPWFAKPGIDAPV
jgi:hypothetical protein